VYELRNKGELVDYFQKALLIKTKSALLKTVRQVHLIMRPGLAEDATKNYLKMTPTTAMGHMNKKRQKIRSTSNTVQVSSDLEDEVVAPGST
jgi:hypothetical protein